MNKKNLLFPVTIQVFHFISEFRPRLLIVDVVDKMEIGGRRLKNIETMAVESVTQAGPPPRSKKANKTFVENPKIPMAVALLVADAILVFLIIAFVPCKFDLHPLLQNFNYSRNRTNADTDLMLFLQLNNFRYKDRLGRLHVPG